MSGDFNFVINNEKGKEEMANLIDSKRILNKITLCSTGLVGKIKSGKNSLIVSLGTTGSGKHPFKFLARIIRKK